MFVKTVICQCYYYGANGNLKENNLLNKDNIEECEHVTEMIRELSCGINGFSMTEIIFFLAYISTN